MSSVTPSRRSKDDAVRRDKSNAPAAAQGTDDARPDAQQPVNLFNSRQSRNASPHRTPRPTSGVARTLSPAPKTPSRSGGMTPYSPRSGTFSLTLARTLSPLPQARHSRSVSDETPSVSYADETKSLAELQQELQDYRADNDLLKKELTASQTQIRESSESRVATRKMMDAHKKDATDLRRQYMTLEQEAHDREEKLKKELSVSQFKHQQALTKIKNQQCGLEALMQKIYEGEAMASQFSELHAEMDRLKTQLIQKDHKHHSLSSKHMETLLEIKERDEHAESLTALLSKQQQSLISLQEKTREDTKLLNQQHQHEQEQLMTQLTNSRAEVKKLDAEKRSLLDQQYVLNDENTRVKVDIVRLTQQVSSTEKEYMLALSLRDAISVELRRVTEEKTLESGKLQEMTLERNNATTLRDALSVELRRLTEEKVSESGKVQDLRLERESLVGEIAALKSSQQEMGKEIQEVLSQRDQSMLLIKE
jgi:chromosome segregation ATPase